MSMKASRVVSPKPQGGESGPLRPDPDRHAPEPRILLIAPHPFFQLRGSPIAERGLLRALAGRGYELHVLAYPHGEDPEVPNCTIHRVPRLPGVDGVPPGFSLRKLLYDAMLLVEAFRLARSLRPCVLHAVEESVFLALLVGRVTGTPVIYDMDSSLPEQLMDQHPILHRAEGLLRAFERRAVRSSAAVVTMSRYLEELARSYDPHKLIARIEDMTLLPTSDEQGDRLRELVGTNAPILLYIGNLAEYQGIDLLIEGFREALAAGAAAELVVIGGSEQDIERYRRMAEREGVARYTHFLGTRPLSQLGWYLKQADVLLSPRKSGRNTPLKIYSYMDSGRAVLATRLETHTQVLDDETACLVEPHPEALGRGLVRLLEDAELRRRLGLRAKRRAQQRYSPAAFERKVVDFYQALRDRALVSGAFDSDSLSSTDR